MYYPLSGAIIHTLAKAFSREHADCMTETVTLAKLWKWVCGEKGPQSGIDVALQQVKRTEVSEASDTVGVNRT